MQDVLTMKHWIISRHSVSILEGISRAVCILEYDTYIVIASSLTRCFVYITALLAYQKSSPSSMIAA
jgi:hypothetical protein